MSRVTDALKEARQQAGLSQRQLAEVLGLSPAFINDLEHGRRELGEKHYATLPPRIRLAVAKAWIADLGEELTRAREMMRDARKDG